jgi:TolA-binding protein
VRSRFPGTEQARSAAFRLGRVAFDQENDYADAARWFAAVLEEGDAGPLAAEARGRLMHAFVRAGDGARARQAAAEYLRSHPDGDYAPLARSLLEDAPLQP